MKSACSHFAVKRAGPKVSDGIKGLSFHQQLRMSCRVRRYLEPLPWENIYRACCALLLECLPSTAKMSSDNYKVEAGDTELYLIKVQDLGPSPPGLNEQEVARWQDYEIGRSPPPTTTWPAPSN